MKPLSNSANIEPTLARFGRNLAETWSGLANILKDWPRVGQRPQLHNIWPAFGITYVVQLWLKLGPDLPNSGRISADLAEFGKNKHGPQAASGRHMRDAGSDW